MTLDSVNHTLAYIRDALSTADRPATPIGHCAGTLPGVGQVVLVLLDRYDGWTVQVVKRDHPHTSYGHYNLSEAQAREQYLSIREAIRPPQEV